MSETPDPQRLIKNLLPVVHKIAKRARSRSPECELDDLVQIGSLGLMEAVSRHGADEAATGWAVRRIRGAILDHLRSQDPLTRGERKRARKLEASRRRLEQTLERAPRASEVASDAGLSFEEYTAIAVHSAATRCTPHDDRLSADLPSSCALLEGKEDRATLAEAVETLQGRLRDVVVSHYLEGESLSDIGKRLRVSPSRMSQLHGMAIEQLRRRCEVSS